MNIASNSLNTWQQLEHLLGEVFCHVKASADGYELTFIKTRDGERLVTVVYVNGRIKGDWCKAENEQPVHPEARFWFPKRGRIWPLKKYPELKKIFGKKKADQMIALRTICFFPTWSSPRTLIQHLKKHFPDLELKGDA
ncbi:MAG: hypothetical protein JXQ84_07785 [Rhodospirillaceae bacterium]|nr:hypothetical protein [Rhodospirillaceae bacterium]